MTDSLLAGARILVVDDEENVRDFFTEALTRREITVVVSKNGEEAARILQETPFDLVVTDLRMPVMDGMGLLRHVMGYHPAIPVIMLTAFATVENAVEAMRNGAFDYLCKPVTDLSQLDVTLIRALQYRRLLVENQELRSELASRYQFDRLVGPGPRMQRVFELLQQVAPTQATVLIMGASGTGKELVARAVHFNSPRARAPFIKVNCAALPEGLIESELFGHEKGAFTGAIKTTRGKFEAANGGTLLMDEIGEMPLGLQAKLLRVLQEKEIQRVGSVENVKIDVRLVATTNVDLDKAVANGRFRQDLFYRLNVIPVTLPPLSERRDDIPVLAYHFLNRYNKVHGKKVERIGDRALQHLVNAPWPGNVRELENAVERAVVLCRTDQLDLRDFFIEPQPAMVSGPEPSRMEFPAAPGETLTLAELEKRHILRTLKELEGRRLQTAQVLEISIRTLRNKLNEYRQQGEDV